MKDEKALNRKKNKLSLIGLFLIFLSPLFIAYYFLSVSGGESEYKNNGTLMTPPKPLKDIKLYDVYKESKSPLYGKWSLLFLNEGVCLRPCQENLYKTRQIRLAMSKHDHRVQRVVVLDRMDASLYAGSFTDEYKGQLVLAKDEMDEAFIDAFRLNNEISPYAKNRIYIVDPMGNVMMSYEDGADPSGIIKDLKILLKSSRIG